jgi:hypothetical protein
VTAVECREWTEELVECARSGIGPSESLDAHLAVCPHCRERWNAERILSLAVGRMRLALVAERSPESRRLELMEEFAGLAQPHHRMRWAWGAAAAAVLVAAAWFPIRHAAAPDTRSNDDFVGAGLVDASEAAGFIPVPYSPPPATGESIEIVHRELDCAELARMGIDVPFGDGDDFDAEIVLGEDGLPRAVRLAGYEEF